MLPLLDGVAGSSKTIAIIRALPDGDISSPFQQTSRIDTKYYYQAVSGYELRLLFAYEVVELERVTTSIAFLTKSLALVKGKTSR